MINNKNENINKPESINPLQSKKTKRLEELGTIQQAEIHSSAQRPLKIIAPLTEAVNVCPCCSLPSETKEIIVPFNLTDNIVTFASTGIGTYLYFYFFHYIIFITFIAMCMAAIPTMAISHHHLKNLKAFCRSFKSNDVYGTTCQYFPEGKDDVFFLNSDWLLYFNVELFQYYRTFYKGDNEPRLVDYSLINFLTLIVLLIINVLFLVLLKNESQLADILNYSPSDYSLLVDNVHNAVQVFKDTRKELEYLKDRAYSEIEAFKKFLLIDVIQCNPDYIQNINLCFRLKHLFKLEKQKEEIETKIIEASYSPNQIELNKKHNRADGKKAYYKTCCCFFKRAILVSDIQWDKNKKQKEINDLIAKCTTDSLKSFADVLFITFDTIKHQEMYYDSFAKTVYHKIINFFYDIKYYMCCCFLSKRQRKRFFRKQKLRVYHAPEPEDVLWENLELTMIHRIIRQCAVYAISLLLIAISGGIVIGLNYSQYKADTTLDNERFEIKYGVSFAISIAITLVNSIFQLVLEKLTNLERHKTRTMYYLSFSVKLSIFTFINSAVIPYVSNVIHDDNEDIMHNTLINNIFFIFLSNSILTPVLWIFNITFIYRRAMIWWLTRKDKEIAMSQRELNELYERPSMDISFKYSFLVKSIAMTFFYLPIFPLGVIITLFGLILAYCIERFNFTHLYKRPEMLNDKICFFYVYYFTVVLFAYGVGNWIFVSDVFKSNAFAYVNIIFFGLMILFPYLILMQKTALKLKESDVNMETYDQMYFKFSNDYERMNPMTKSKGMKEYLVNLKKNNLISQEAFDYACDNLAQVNLLEMYYKSSLNQTNYQIGNQLFKTGTMMGNGKNNNMPLGYCYSQVNKVVNGNSNSNCIVNNSQADSHNQFQGQEQNQPQVLNPYDQQIINTFSFGYAMLPSNFNCYNNNNNNNDIGNKLGYNPNFNPFMPNPIFGNGVYERNDNIPQVQANVYNSNEIIQPQSQLPQVEHLDNDNNNNVGYSSHQSNNIIHNNNYNQFNQGYNSHSQSKSQDIPIEPGNYHQRHQLSNNIGSSIPNNKQEDIGYNPFSIMTNNNPLLQQPRQKQPDILPNTLSQFMEDSTPGNPSIPLYNYNLGPVLDQPVLDPIIESNLDSNDVVVSFQLPKKKKMMNSSVIDNAGDE